MQNGAFQVKFYEFGSRGIWDTVYLIYVRKPLILLQKHHFYNINKVYHISNTPGTKFMKIGLKCSILQFEMNKTIIFELYFFHLNLFLNPYKKFMLNSTTFKTMPYYDPPYLKCFPDVRIRFYDQNLVFYQFWF